MKVTLILACAGEGKRAGFSKNKLLISADGTTVLQKTLSVFFKSNLIDEYIVTLSEKDFNEVAPTLPDGVNAVLGGNTRTESVKNALSKTTGDIVLIHDGARCFITERVIKDCIDCAIKFGSAIPIVPVRDTICSSDGEKVLSYLGKSGLFAVQTPQGFNTKNLKKAYDESEGITFNDDGEVYSSVFGKVNTYMGDSKNIKLTYSEDFDALFSLPLCKIGNGFDCHKLVENRPLILGGITIPHDKGLLGHSDADVLTHAVMDAMLSACALRDIGYHFPDTDEQFKGADSIKLLERVIVLCRDAGYNIKSLSAVIMAQKPKLLPHIKSITENLAKVLNLKTSDIGIGATTLEGLGFVGREEGICVSASCIMVKI